MYRDMGCKALAYSDHMCAFNFRPILLLRIWIGDSRTVQLVRPLELLMAWHRHQDWWWWQTWAHAALTHPCQSFRIRKAWYY
jgi:hypothetical protein